MMCALAISFGIAYRSPYQIFPPISRCFQHHVRFSCAVVAAIEALDDPPDNHFTDSSFSTRVQNGSNGANWKKLSSKELGITNSMISRPTRIVLNGLKRKGFDVYLVGGCVRDLVLRRTPKDFDIITSAELKEVLRTFSWCEIVGKRFPICHVHIDDTIVEVSSFSTCSTKSRRDIRSSLEMPIGCDEKDYIRWRNCLQRDFTINGLMFDPYAKFVYDYTGGFEDLRKAKVRTVTPANVSLVEDCARILRAIRIAARLGFSLARDTVHAVKHSAYSILRLDKGRLLMELNYMLAYGSSEPSLRLLWRYGLLEILLPIQAAYFVRNGFRRRQKESNMLLTLFSNMDKFLAPDRPCHSSLWVAILAFHKAISEKARDPLVVATFSLAVHLGGDLQEAVKIARSVSIRHDCRYPEILEPQDLDSKELVKEVKHLGVSVARALADMTDEHYVSQAMAAYPSAPYSDLVIIPLVLYLRTVKIFECVYQGKERGFVPKQGSKIDYEFLAIGSLQEVRHVFARIVFDTIFPTNLGKS